MTESVIRIIYKVIYFYIFPLLVIPVGVIGWRLTNVEKEKQHEVDWTSIKEQYFDFNDYLQIYSFVILISYGIALYYVLSKTTFKLDWNGNSKELYRAISKDISIDCICKKVKIPMKLLIVLTILLGPFLMYAGVFLSKEFRQNILPVLQ
jgi:hypothetical protein